MSRAALAIVYQATGQSVNLPITIFKKPSNDAEYAKLEKQLDILIDQVRDNENHKLAIVMEIIGENLEQYDNENYQVIGHGLSEAERVQYLMDKHNMHQNDLAAVFGGQANVSKFLNGERSLNKKHISELKKLFKISADYFL